MKINRPKSNQPAQTNARHFSPRIATVSIVATCLFLAQAGMAATGQINYNTVYQQLEGFGGAAVYDVTSLTTHSQREAIYDLVFKELGIEILRIRNCYGYDSGSINATKTIIAEAREPQRSPNLKLELVPWSPAAYLKSNESVNGGTLAGGPSDYVYDDYAQWWYDSLLEWASGSNGVIPDFISLQNEPDFETTYDSCKFGATESSSYAGYDQAFEAVYNKLYTEMGPNMPQMWAPCTVGFGSSISYINALINIGQIDNVDGFSHHLYGDGSYDAPDGMITGMINYGNNYGYKPLHMTEYVKLSTTPNFDMGLKFAWHIYNCLYYEGVTSFFNWTLFRGPDPDGGGIVTMTSTSDHVIRPQYWFLKGYTYFTDEGWYVVDASVEGTGASNLRMAAFKSPDNSRLTIVITNISTSSTGLTLTLNDFSPDTSEVYRSSETENWVDLGTYSPSLTLPAESITTIALFITGPQQTLSVSSTSGGSVTTPGEGDFQYPQDTDAVITATPDWHYHFNNWTGTAVDASKVAEPCAPSTTVFMDANYTVVANFEADPPSSDVELLAPWQWGLAHDKIAGPNRALIFIAHGESTSSMNLSSVTYGGESMEKVVDYSYNAAGGWAYAAAFILDEAGISAASPNTFNPTWGGTAPGSSGYASVFLANVDQTDPTGATDSGGSTNNPVTTSALSTEDGDMVILAATCGQAGSYTLNNGFIEGTEQQMNGTVTGVTGHKPATGADETPSATYSSYINRQMIIGFVVQAAFHSYQNCADVQAGGYGLVSDFDGDCYVDYSDLETMVYYWLHTDCAGLGDCENADIEPDGDVDLVDFSDFAVDWLRCNKPQEPGCIQNW